LITPAVFLPLTSTISQVAVQVHRMGIVGTISHDKPIARALLQHEFPVVRIGFGRSRAIGLNCQLRSGLLEDQFDGLLRES